MCLGLLSCRDGLIQVLLTGDVSCQQGPIAILFHTRQCQFGRVHAELSRGDLDRLRVPGLLNGGTFLGEPRGGNGQLVLEGFFLNLEQYLSGVDVRAFFEQDLFQDSAHPGAERDLFERPCRAVGIRLQGHTGLFGHDDADRGWRRLAPRLRGALATRDA